jgi:structural maintenance of chromosome 2
MRASIQQLKQDIIDAKARQDQAKADVKRIENDMNEFKNNKGGKLAELQVRQRFQQLVLFGN